jgi:ribulose-5-phosphate 4-epimerase/fuculose-1-phosphate aldolase
MASPRRNLVTANRIYARHNILDAYGHCSIRDPENPEQFIMSRARAPELVTEDDLLTLDLDGELVDPNEKRGPYSERFIHAAVYEARPEVRAICHSHTPSIIPFGVTEVPLRAICHLGAVVGKDVPVWDIAEEFGDTNLLVSNQAQGRSLAKALGNNKMALMRGHGCVLAGGSIQEVVRNGIYMDLNARLLTTALIIGGGKVHYLSPGEMEERLTRGGAPSGEVAAQRQERQGDTMSREWEAWVAQVGRLD